MKGESCYLLQSLETGIKIGGLELRSSGFQVQMGPDELRESEAERGLEHAA